MYKKVLLSVLCVALMCSVALGDADTKWIGGAVGDMNNIANWSGGGTNYYTNRIVADFTDAQNTAMNNYATDTSGANGRIVANMCPSPTAWRQQVINTWASDGTIAVNGMYWSSQESCTNTVLNIRCNLSTGDLYMTDTTYGRTTINQYAGNVTAGQVRLPRAYNGVYNMFGGTLYAAQLRMPRRGSEYGALFAYTAAEGGLGDELTLDGDTPLDSATAELNIYAGTVTTPYLDINNGKKPAGIVRIGRTATLILIGDQLDFANGLIAGGSIVGVNNPVSASLIGGNTVIVPEPATMLMLGLGALGLIRRKK